MNVCHVTYGEFPGAGTSTIYEYPLAEAAQGVNVSVIARQFDSPEYEITNIDGVIVHRLPVASEQNQWLRQLQFVKRASRIIRDNHFNVIHLYANIGISSPFLRVFSGFVRNNTVWIRDFRSAPISIRQRMVKFRPTEFLLRLQSVFFDADFCQSEGTRDKIFGAHRHDMFIARQGANFKRFQKTASTLDDLELSTLSGQTILIYIGALTAQRDCKRLIHAMSISLKTLDDSISLLIVGDGNEMANLQRLVQELEIEKQVIFIGKVDYEQVPKYLSIADIGLAYVPATRVLGAQPPLKTVEMLACGLPVIATDTRGNRHFIKERDNGLLVKDEPEAIASAIVELVNDNVLRTLLVAKARESVVQYDYANIVSDTIIPKYNELIKVKA